MTVSNLQRTVSDAYKNNFLESWGEISRLRKPVIAAVSGYAVRRRLYCICVCH